MYVAHESQVGMRGGAFQEAASELGTRGSGAQGLRGLGVWGSGLEGQAGRRNLELRSLGLGTWSSGLGSQGSGLGPRGWESWGSLRSQVSGLGS